MKKIMIFLSMSLILISSPIARAGEDLCDSKIEQMITDTREKIVEMDALIIEAELKAVGPMAPTKDESKDACLSVEPISLDGLNVGETFEEMTAGLAGIFAALQGTAIGILNNIMNLKAILMGLMGALGASIGDLCGAIIGETFDAAKSKMDISQYTETYAEIPYTGGGTVGFDSENFDFDYDVDTKSMTSDLLSGF